MGREMFLFVGEGLMDRMDIMHGAQLNCLTVRRS
jgi:hypothetical protein